MDTVTTASNTPTTGATTATTRTIPEEDGAIDIKGVKYSSVSAQTISPEGSIVSPVSSLDSLEERKRRYSDITETRDAAMSILATPEDEEAKIKLPKSQPLSSTGHQERHPPGETDLNMVDKEANEILEEIKNSIKETETSLQNTLDAVEQEKLTRLLQSLVNAKSLILKLNLNKNLFKFQITSELEQNNIEKQILLRNLETFKQNLNSLQMDNEVLREKNNKLIKYYKFLKYGKLKDLKQKNAKLSRELDSFKNGYSQPQGSQISSSSSNSSSGRSSVAYLSKTNNNYMLNTLGMLASQVLANEDSQPQESDSLPPTFGSMSSFKSTSHSRNGSLTPEDGQR